jgi:D-3-phosphoglycerate dehydrogenase
MKKVIITARCHDYLVTQLRQYGYEVEYSPAITEEELLHKIATAEGLVITTRIKVGKRLIDLASQLKWIGRLGSGLELVDVDYAEQKGIKVFASPEGNRDAVAEHTLGLLLSMMHRIALSAVEVKNGVWKREENRGIELRGKTVGIIGFGNTGSGFARLLEPFQVTVLAYDKYKSGFGGDYIKEANLEQLCRYSDVISLHIPITGETQHFANKPFFDSMERQPFFINTSRGKVTDTSALYNAIQENRIRAAALDVLETEPPEKLNGSTSSIIDQLLSDPRVIITPHIAGYSKEAFFKMAEVLSKKILH